MFGSLADMEELIAEAGKRNIKIIMDMVLNHSSDEHRWFVEAKKGKDNPYHDYYVWRDGKEGVPPNDMTSAFGRFGVGMGTTAWAVLSAPVFGKAA